MKNLPKINQSPVTQSQRDRLGRWLAVRRLDQELESTIGEMAPAESAGPEIPAAEIRRLIRPFDLGVAVGDIRLLSPRLAPADGLPRYVAVLKEWDEDEFLVAPYSKYPEPAVTGELATGRNHFSIDCLELWNARAIHRLALKHSWLADRMSDAEQADAWVVFAHAFAGKPLPEALADRVGPPVFVPEDPRLEYQAEEAAAMAPLAARSAEIAAWTAAATRDAAESKTVLIPMPCFAMPAAAADGVQVSPVIRGDGGTLERLLSGADPVPGSTAAAEAVLFRSDSERVDWHWVLPADFHPLPDAVTVVLDRTTGEMVGDAAMSEEDGDWIVVFSAPSDDRLRELRPEDVCLVLI